MAKPTASVNPKKLMKPVHEEEQIDEDSGVAQQQRRMTLGDLDQHIDQRLEKERKRVISAAKLRQQRRQKHSKTLRAKKDHAEKLKRINMHTEADMDTGSGMSSGNDENDKTVVKNNGNVFDTAKARGTKTGKDDPLKIELSGKKDTVEVNPIPSRPV
jgi:hypothetical protein